MTYWFQTASVSAATVDSGCISSSDGNCVGRILRPEAASWNSVVGSSFRALSTSVVMLVSRSALLMGDSEVALTTSDQRLRWVSRPLVTPLAYSWPEPPSPADMAMVTLRSAASSMSWS